MLGVALSTLVFICASTPLPVSSNPSEPEPGRQDARVPVEQIRLAPDERLLVARAILGEAIGEGRVGMIAVGHVIQNRVRLRGARIQNARFFGETIPEILQQFDAMNPRKGGKAYRMASSAGPRDERLLLALSVVDEVFSDASEDPTGGALFYYNPNTVREPAWAEHFAPYNDRQIGNHRFLGQISLAEASVRRPFGSFVGVKPLKTRLPARGIQG